MVQIQIWFIVRKVYNKSRDCKFESQLSQIIFMKIDHKILSVFILPSDSRSAVVSDRQTYVHKYWLTM